MTRSKTLIIVAFSGALLAAATLYHVWSRGPAAPIAVVTEDTAPYPFSVWLNDEPLGYAFENRHSFNVANFPLTRGPNKIEARAAGRLLPVGEALKVYRNVPPDYPEISVNSAGFFKRGGPPVAPPEWLSPIDDTLFDEAAILSASEKIMDALIDRRRESMDALFTGDGGSRAVFAGVFQDREWTQAERAERAHLKVARGKHLIVVYASVTDAAGPAERGVPLVALHSQGFRFKLKALRFYYDSHRKLALYVSDPASEDLRKTMILK